MFVHGLSALLAVILLFLFLLKKIAFSFFFIFFYFCFLQYYQPCDLLVADKLEPNAKILGACAAVTPVVRPEFIEHIAMDSPSEQDYMMYMYEAPTSHGEEIRPICNLVAAVNSRCRCSRDHRPLPCFAGWRVYWPEPGSIDPSSTSATTTTTTTTATATAAAATAAAAAAAATAAAITASTTTASTASTPPPAKRPRRGKMSQSDLLKRRRDKVSLLLAGGAIMVERREHATHEIVGLDAEMSKASTSGVVIQAPPLLLCEPGPVDLTRMVPRRIISYIISSMDKPPPLDPNEVEERKKVWLCYDVSIDMSKSWNHTCACCAYRMPLMTPSQIATKSADSDGKRTAVKQAPSHIAEDLWQAACCYTDEEATSTDVEGMLLVAADYITHRTYLPACVLHCVLLHTLPKARSPHVVAAAHELLQNDKIQHLDAQGSSCHAQRSVPWLPSNANDGIVGGGGGGRGIDFVVSSAWAGLMRLLDLGKEALQQQQTAAVVGARRNSRNSTRLSSSSSAKTKASKGSSSGQHDRGSSQPLQPTPPRADAMCVALNYVRAALLDPFMTPDKAEQAVQSGGNDSSSPRKNVEHLVKLIIDTVVKLDSSSASASAISASASSAAADNNLEYFRLIEALLAAAQAALHVCLYDDSDNKLINEVAAEFARGWENRISFTAPHVAACLLATFPCARTRIVVLDHIARKVYGGKKAFKKSASSGSGSGANVNNTTRLNASFFFYHLFPVLSEAGSAAAILVQAQLYKDGISCGLWPRNAMEIWGLDPPSDSSSESDDAGIITDLMFAAATARA